MRRSLVFLFLALPLAAQSGMWGSRGITKRFAVSGSRLFAAEGRGVAVYDIANPATPKRLGGATRDDETIDVAVMSDSRLVSLTAAGIDKWSVGANGQLSLIASQPKRGATLIAANASTIVASRNGALDFYDSSLAQTGTISVPAPVSAIVFHGNTLFVALGGIGIETIDVTDLATDFIPERASDLAVSGDTLYAASGSSGLTIIDVASAPHTLSRTDGGNVNFTRVAVAGTRVYVSNGDASLRAYDATNPTAPQLISVSAKSVRAIAASGNAVVTDRDVDAPGVPVSGVALSPNGSIAYVIDKPFLRVIDVSTTSAPHEIASLQIDGIEDLVRINGDGTRVVLYNRGDVQVVDVTNPYKPKLIGVWHSGGSPPSRAAFFRNGVVEANWTTGFHVLDFDHYVPPAIVGAFIFDYWDLEATPDGDAAYVTAEQTQLATIDLTDHHHPRSPSHLPLHMDEGGFAAPNGNHAQLLVARAPDGIHLFSLADAMQPSPIAFVPMTDAVALAVGGQTAFVAASGKITTIDLANAASPSASVSTMAATAASQMAAEASKLVIADTYSLRVYGPNTPPVPLPTLSRRRPSRP